MPTGCIDTHRMLWCCQQTVVLTLVSMESDSLCLDQCSRKAILCVLVP